MLDTVVASADIADVVSVRRSRVFSVRFSNPRIDVCASNAYKAALFMSREYNLPPFEASIINNIPCGCGLGGSSADCAGMILALKKAFSLAISEEEMRRTAAMFGSDTPYMLKGGYARLKGRGEKAEFFYSRFSEKILIAYEGEVCTRKCFEAFDESGFPGIVADNDFMVNALVRCDKEKVFASAKNALAPAATALNRFADKISSYPTKGFKTITGSGSGVVIFGADEGDAALCRTLGARVIESAVLSSDRCGSGI